MKKFNLIGIEMSTKVSVIPTSTRLCVKAVKASCAHDRIFSGLYSLLHNHSSISSEDKEMRDVIEGVLSDLSVINDFVQPIVNALEDDDDDENYPAC